MRGDVVVRLGAVGDVGLRPAPEDGAKRRRGAEHHGEDEAVGHEPQRRLHATELPLAQSVRHNLGGQKELHVGTDQGLRRDAQP